MDTTTYAALENDIVSLLSELSETQDELLHVLRKKRELMAKSDIPAMNELASREQQLAVRLQLCQQQRHALLQRAGKKGLPARSVQQLAAAMPTENRGNLGETVKNASARHRLLKNECLTNWVVTQRSLLHISQLLEIFATGGRSKSTYGKGESAHSSGALVDREV